MANIVGRDSGSEAQFAVYYHQAWSGNVACRLTLLSMCRGQSKICYRVPIKGDDRCMAIARRVVNGRLASYPPSIDPATWL
jgi:hypothetical protein